MPNYATEVEPGIWQWEGEYYYVDDSDDFDGNGPFATQEEAKAAHDKFWKELKHDPS